jgi:hypothetical protein
MTPSIEQATLGFDNLDGIPHRQQYQNRISPIIYFSASSVIQLQSDLLVSIVSRRLQSKLKPKGDLHVHVGGGRSHAQ